MKVDDCFDDFTYDEGTDVFGKTASSFYVFVEISTVDVLGDYVDVGFASDGLLVFDDLRMGDDFHDLAFILQSYCCFGGQFLGADVLESVGLACFFGSAAIDYGEFACSDDLMSIV